ncbi:MAG: hypothetical protein KAS96_06265 [Planctomycetes bacterium]|nr:hypothetical protein [Planctomycetota bacterium]
MRTRQRLFLFTTILLLANNYLFAANQQSKTAVIVCGKDASVIEKMAAKEIRRYVYLRTDKLLEIVEKSRGGKNLIIIGQKNSGVFKPVVSGELKKEISALCEQQYIIKTVTYKGKDAIVIAGGDEVGTLYGAYQFVETMGVRFYMHGDVVGDEKIAFVIPQLDIKDSPLFELRGIHPFHDFPEGPDWWNRDGYKAILGQLPKMRMNFFGLHTYPQGGAGPEPTVWIGEKENIGKKGKVKSSYPSRHFTTYSGTWGYQKRDTGDFLFGGDQMFEKDGYGVDYMRGMMDWPETDQEKNALFYRMGNLLKDAFDFANMLGIKTCIGTETPLTIPLDVKQRLRDAGKNPEDPEVVQGLYEGMFKRIMETHKLDYYWIWTPEGWTWNNKESDDSADKALKDIQLAVKAKDNVGAGFRLATCGWVLGPAKDRSMFDDALGKDMPMSCISRGVGFDFVEPGFEEITGRDKWAIPWFEDDGAMIIPQLWVGRMRKDAADALKYGCNGLMGIHWRTRILGPNVSALAKASWLQQGWNPDFDLQNKKIESVFVEGAIGGNPAAYANSQIAKTDDDGLYNSVRYDVKGYQFKVDNGGYKVTLKFSEIHYDEAGKRIFAVKLQGKKVIDRLDIFEKVGKNYALDYTFDDVDVSDGVLKIGFDRIVEHPCISAIVIEGKGVAKRINCGGNSYGEYAADMNVTPQQKRNLATDDFYIDWAKTNFGKEAAEDIAQIFISIDGKLPRPSQWVDGPGGIMADKRPWGKVKGAYDFVDQMGALKGKIKGKGNVERFDYWLNNFIYLRETAKGNCLWGRYNDIMEKVRAETNAARKKEMALKEALPVRKELLKQSGIIQKYLLATVTTTGAMGNVANWNQHVYPVLLNNPENELAGIIGELPQQGQCKTYKKYEGDIRMFVPVVRTSLEKGEGLNLKVIVLGDRVKKGLLYYREMGSGKFKAIDIKHVNRGVYQVRIAGKKLSDINTVEYYLDVETFGGEKLRWPVTSPEINQTVIMLD